MASIFLCHSSRDKSFVRELAAKLRAAGVRVWLDEAEIRIGDSLTTKIGHAIDRMEYFGVVLSRHSVASGWVQRELEIAIQRELAERKVIVLPLLLEPVDRPPFLRDKLYADFTTPERFHDALPKLLEALGAASSAALGSAGDDTDDSRTEVPSDRLQLRRSGMRALARQVERRSFFRILGRTVIALGTGGLLARLADFSELFGLGERTFERLSQSEERLLRASFGLTGPVAAVPAGDHPFKRPQDVYPTACFYPIETQVADAYRRRFFAEMAFRRVSGYPEVREDDSLVLFGSQVSNVTARRLFGAPWLTPSFTITFRQQWRTELEWTLHTPTDAPIQEIVQYDRPWISKGHRFVSRAGQIYKSTYAPHQTDDFLLVTSVPRYRRGPQRILAFAGLHGPGTRSAIGLLSEPPLRELDSLLSKTGGEPYYQALFHATVAADSAGRATPTALTLVDARALKLIFA